MPWIHTVPPDDAKGPLARIYRAAVQRAGKVFHILRVQSLNPPVLRSSIALYKDVMFGESPLDRATREMIAVVVSRANDCHYWILAHAADLRAEVHDDGLVEAIRADHRSADLDPPTRALLDYAEKLTRSPASITAGDVDALRALGWSDRAIHDAAQVTAYFNYINRIADGLGVDLEPDMPAKP